MRDPKFGYHWIWILPIWAVCELYYSTIAAYKRIKHRIKIKRILKQNPDIEELSKLSGIKK